MTETAKTPLQKAISERGCKISWVLQKTGITYMKLRDLRNGTSEPSLSQAQSLSDVLEIPVENLFPKNAKN